MFKCKNTKNDCEFLINSYIGPFLKKMRTFLCACCDQTLKYTWLN